MAEDAPSMRADLAAALRDSRNVGRIVGFSLVYNVALAVWNGPVWAPFLMVLFRDNTKVGWVAAAQGATEVITAVVTGLLADRLGRDAVIRASAVVQAAAAVAMGIGAYSGNFWALVGAASGAGAAYGCFFPSVEALLADSVAGGRRTALYSAKYALEIGSGLVGVAISVGLLLGIGDRWEAGPLRVVICVGAGLSGLSAALLFTISSRHALPVDPEPLPGAGVSSAGLPSAGSDSQSTEGSSAPSTAPMLLSATSLPPGDEAPTAGLVERGDGSCSGWRVGLRAAPFVLAASNILLMLGSGMTVMFFGLFLIDRHGTSPVVLQGIEAGCIVLTAGGCQLLSVADSRGYSRFTLNAATLAVGVGGILYLALVTGGPLASAAPVYIAYTLRYAGLNAVNGMQRALTMDMVPGSSRGRWNAVESVLNASWSGSAVLGGVIADRGGYRLAFLVAAGMQLAALLIALLLVRTPDPKAGLRGLKAAPPGPLISDDEELIIILAPPAPAAEDPKPDPRRPPRRPKRLLTLP